MPKRIVDGDALWTSSKLAAVQPAHFRLHYANWLPMAEANGVFEANPDLIWSKIYSYLQPTTTKNKVLKIISEFERVGLISTWFEVGKKWGYFVGIHKAGRLPTDSHLTRYKNLPPDYKQEPVPDSPGSIRSSPEGFGLVLNRFGVGLEEQDMTLKTKITDKAREVLGSRIPNNEKTWVEITSLGRIYGQTEVFDAFSDWAVSSAGEPCHFPLAEFIRVADNLLKPDHVAKSSPDVGKVISEITFISQGTVVPDSKQTFILARWLESYAIEEILSAFRTYYAQIENDSFQVKFGAKNFVEKGVALMDLARRNKATDTQQGQVINRQLAEMEQEAELFAQEDDLKIEERLPQ